MATSHYSLLGCSLPRTAARMRFLLARDCPLPPVLNLLLFILLNAELLRYATVKHVIYKTAHLHTNLVHARITSSVRTQHPCQACFRLVAGVMQARNG